MKLYVLLLCCAMSQHARAAAESFEVQKVSFARRSLGEYELTLRAVQQGQDLWGCKNFKVQGTYSFLKWKVRVRARSSPTWRGHTVTLGRLAAIDSPFLLLVAGEGLSTRAPCVFVSEGLMSYYTTNGRLNIMTYYRNS